MTEDRVDTKNAERMIGKSEIIWVIMEQMNEISPSWACEEMWSTLRVQMDLYLSVEDQRKLRIINMEVRDLIKKIPKREVKE